jgi:hypothetical protein
MKIFTLILIVCCFVTGCANNSESFVDTNSFDYKYSKARFQVEGYSNKDSETAAKAIYKFNQAQKNRKSY